MTQRKLIYRGQTKSLYESNVEPRYLLHFRDDAPSGGIASFEGKGVLNNRISAHIMQNLNAVGINTHLVQRENMREQSVMMADVLPIRFRMQNRLGQDTRDRLGLSDDHHLPYPLLEFYFINESGDYRLVSHDHIVTFGWVHPDDFESVFALTNRANDFLCGMLAAVGFTLIEFTMELGWVIDRGSNGIQTGLAGERELRTLMIVDELSPDIFHLREERSGFDYRCGLPAHAETEPPNVYVELARRFNILPELPALDDVNESGRVTRMRSKG